MNEREQDVLIEACVTARRELDAHGNPVPPAVWWDLPTEALDELFERQLLSRVVERLIDPEGHSATVKAVLSRVGR